MFFQVEVQLSFIDGSASPPIRLEFQASDAESVTETITPDWIMENVSDDWGPPIQSVQILKIDAASRRSQSC